MSNNSTPLYALTIGEYIELTKEIFSEEFEEIQKLIKCEQPKEKGSDIIFIDEVSRITGYKKSTIYSKVTRFEMPVMGRGRPLAFSRSILEKWLVDGRPNLIDQEAYEYLNDRP